MSARVARARVAGRNNACIGVPVPSATANVPSMRSNTRSMDRVVPASTAVTDVMLNLSRAGVVILIGGLRPHAVIGIAVSIVVLILGCTNSGNRYRQQANQ